MPENPEPTAGTANPAAPPTQPGPWEWKLTSESVPPSHKTALLFDGSTVEGKYEVGFWDESQKCWFTGNGNFRWSRSRFTDWCHVQPPAR